MSEYSDNIDGSGSKTDDTNPKGKDIILQPGLHPFVCTFEVNRSADQKCWHCLQIKKKSFESVRRRGNGEVSRLGRFRSHPGRMRSCVLAGRRPKESLKRHSGLNDETSCLFLLGNFFYLWVERYWVSEFFYQNYFLPWQYITLK